MRERRADAHDVSARAPELFVLLMLAGFIAAVGVGLYWIVRAAVAADSQNVEKPPPYGQEEP